MVHDQTSTKKLRRVLLAVAAVMLVVTAGLILLSKPYWGAEDDPSLQIASEFTCSPSPCCSSVAQSCPTLCNPMDCSMPGFPILHHLPELAQTHLH